MRKIAPILTLLVLVAMLGAGAVTAQGNTIGGESENQEVIEDTQGVADLAVDVTLTDSEGNPIDEAMVGDEVVGVVEATNNGPDGATGVVVYLRQNGFGNTEVENIVNWWAVSWDGINWIESDPSFDPVEGIWYIGDYKAYMPAGDVYTLVMGFTAKEAGEGLLGAYIEGEEYDPNLINNDDEYVIDIIEPVTPSAEKVPMQPTGASLALAIFSVLMTIAGLAIPRIK